MTQFTEHLSEEELSCYDKKGTFTGTPGALLAPYPFDQEDTENPCDGLTWRTTRATPLGELFEAIRALCGDLPITVDSAFRTLAYDEKLYEADRGAGNVAPPQGSQHPKGRALDLFHSQIKPIAFFYMILKAFDEEKSEPTQSIRRVIYEKLGGIGLYPSFVHVDVRPRPSNDHLAIWGGTRPTNIV